MGINILTMNTSVALAKTGGDKVDDFSSGDMSSQINAVIKPLETKLADLSKAIDTQEMFIWGCVALIVLLIVMIAYMLLKINKLEEKLQKSNSSKNNTYTKDEIDDLEEKILKAYNEMVDEFKKIPKSVNNQSSSISTVTNNIDRVSSKVVELPKENVSNTYSKTSVTAALGKFSVNKDGLTSLDEDKIRKFISDYNWVAKNYSDDAFEQEEARNSFIKKYSLQQIGCNNGTKVVSTKEKPRYITTDTDVFFYALPIKDNIYAVVPVLWRNWEDIHMEYFEIAEIFKGDHPDLQYYTHVYVSEAAFFVHTGNNWELKRAGRADFRA